MSPRQKPLGGKGGGVNEVSEGQQLGWPKADQKRIRSDRKAQMWEVKRTELACKRGKRREDVRKLRSLSRASELCAAQQFHCKHRSVSCAAAQVWSRAPFSSPSL